MIRRPDYSSDYMSEIMDERLEQLEERLTALYANAALETQSDFYDFMEKYKKDYLAMLEKLDAEEITKAEFDLWCSKKILKTTQYKKMIATLTNILVNTDVAAMAIIRGKLPFVVAQSYNFAQSLGFAAADKAGLSVGTFQVYNAWSVQKIIKDNPKLLPTVDIPLDKQWNKDKINTAITHSIIHGDSIPKVAKRLKEVTNMDKNSAIRNARTSMTGAENLGRNESIKFMKKNGVPVQLMWSATHDSRTRDTHLLLDRTFQNEKGYFGEGILSKLIKFPGDPEGLPQEIYNCRCRASIYLEGIDHSKDAELYEKFMTENYPDDYRQLKEWEEKKGRAEERRQTLEYQKVLKEIHKTGYYDPNSFAKSVEPIVDKNPDKLSKDMLEIIGEKGPAIAPEKLLETVNPNFPEKGYTDNCQRCVVGYELGRRGYDVEALAFDGSFLSTEHVLDISPQTRHGQLKDTRITGEEDNPIFALSKYPFNRSPKTTANSIIRAMSDWGEGSRATLEVVWRQGGGAHVVNVENIGGKIQIIDAQCGMIFDNIEGYLARTQCAKTELKRTDVLNIRNSVPQEILSRICKKRG